MTQPKILSSQITPTPTFTSVTTTDTGAAQLEFTSPNINVGKLQVNTTAGYSGNFDLVAQADGTGAPGYVNCYCSDFSSGIFLAAVRPGSSGSALLYSGNDTNPAMVAVNGLSNNAAINMLGGTQASGDDICKLTCSGTASNISLTFEPKGSGVVNISTNIMLGKTEGTNATEIRKNGLIAASGTVDYVDGSFFEIYAGNGYDEIQDPPVPSYGGGLAFIAGNGGGNGNGPFGSGLGPGGSINFAAGYGLEGTASGNINIQTMYTTLSLDGATGALQINGIAGGAGDVLTSGGASAPPYWSTPINTADTVTFESDIVLPKTTNKGIMVDTETPTFGWRDITGEITVRGSGANNPAWANFITNINAYQFDVNAEAWLTFHVPHDYVPGSEIFIHTHWAITNTSTSNVTWGFDASYAKGYAQQAFAATTNKTVATAGSGVANYHIISEVQLSTGGGTLGGNTIEVDGLILVRVYLSANAAGVDPFMFTADLHYQSTNMATKGRNGPGFYD